MNSIRFRRSSARALGEKDEAIVLLEKDIGERGTYLAAIEIDPALDDLRDDPQFATLVQKVVAAKLD